MIRIKNKTGLGHHTEFYNENGTRIYGVEKVEFAEIRRDTAVQATITFVQTELDIEAEPLLSLESLERFAKHYGYKLIKDDYE